MTEHEWNRRRLDHRIEALDYFIDRMTVLLFGMVIFFLACLIGTALR